MSLAHRSVYATQPSSLRQQVDDLLHDAPRVETEGTLVGLIVPDSNRLSGASIAARAYKLLEGASFDTAMLVAPSHEGAFGRLAICTADTYYTPLGDVPVNDALRNELCDEDDDIYLDDRGHYHTEGANVQIPFLQRTLGDDFTVVPIAMGEESPELCRELGAAIGEVMYGKQAIVIGSADLLRVKEGALTRFTDALEAFNLSELMYLLGSETVLVEGMGAVLVTLIAAQRRGANRVEILRLSEPTDDEPGAFACALWRT
ncbi:MAG: AmmeMemoRadiSam system protein B [Rhodothermaceae bacterium]|nr:AmmeMemoRadiSam system protein B [Rhodothermaceae bacterium]